MSTPPPKKDKPGNKTDSTFLETILWDSLTSSLSPLSFIFLSFYFFKSFGLTFSSVPHLQNLLSFVVVVVGLVGLFILFLSPGATQLGAHGLFPEVP